MQKNHLFSIRELLFIFADFYFGYHLETFQEYDKIRMERQGDEPLLANAPQGGALPAVFFFEKICMEIIIISMILHAKFCNCMIKTTTCE